MNGEKFEFNSVNLNPFFILNQLFIKLLWLFLEFFLKVGILLEYATIVSLFILYW